MSRYNTAWPKRVAQPVTNGSATSALSCYQMPVAISGSAYTSLVPAPGPTSPTSGSPTPMA